MATYRFSAQLISRAKGRSAIAAAAYRAGERIRDERTGEVFDFRRRQDVLDCAILTPHGNRFGSRAALWNAVEEAERRRDAQVAREIQLSLPHELSLDANRKLLHGFVSEQFVRAGMIADVAIHGAHLGGDVRNIHAHVLLTTRGLTEEGFGAKVRLWNERSLLEAWRSEWAASVNRALERAALQERVSHLSYAARGIDLEAEPKQGPVATKMERYGRASKAGHDRRAARNRNHERRMLRTLQARLDAAIEPETISRKTTAKIAPFEQPEWQTAREKRLSTHYASDLAGSDLARFWRVRQERSSIIYENARGRFVDEGRSVTSRDENDLVIRGMLYAAKAHGWQTLEISGSDDFRRRAMRMALDRGFEIRAKARDVELLSEARAAHASAIRARDVDCETEWER